MMFRSMKPGMCMALTLDTGKRDAKPLIVTAHLDTVFPHGYDLRVTREPELIHGPGLGDNSLGVAALFGLLWMLRERRLQLGGDVWFVANVCEEGLGDLRGMKAVVERFGADVRAYLVLEGLALGHVYHRAVGVKRYRVTARTSGGHSWSDYGKPPPSMNWRNWSCNLQLSSCRVSRARP